MNIICTQENLRLGLQTAGRIISNSNTLPILNNVLLKTTNGQLTISATNLEIAIITTIRCKIEEEGEACLPAKTLLDLVNNLPNQNITLATTDQGISIKTEHYSTLIKSLPSEDFPLIPSIDKTLSFSLPAQDLKQGIDQVVFAASQSETQPEISGILFRLKERFLYLVATDRYRLAQKRIELPKSQGLKDVILPHKTAQEISRVIAGGVGDIEISLSDNQAAFIFNETQVISRLIEGQYPEYEQIVPEQFTTTVTVNRQELSAALKTSGIFSYTSHSVVLEYNDTGQKVKISSSSHDLGESAIDIPSVINGPAGTILFNYRYILDALSTITEPTVTIKVVNDGAPVIFTPENHDGYMYLVMPIKT
jgi:DNA polymerase III subunit beta